MSTLRSSIRNVSSGQSRARSRMTSQRLIEVGRHAGESVQQELIVGDLGRHPVRLRIDRRQPAHRHVVSRLGSQDGPLPPRRCCRLRVRTAPSSSPARHPVSARSSHANSPAAVTNWCLSPVEPTACAELAEVAEHGGARAARRPLETRGAGDAARPGGGARPRRGHPGQQRRAGHPGPGRHVRSRSRAQPGRGRRGGRGRPVQPIRTGHGASAAAGRCSTSHRSARSARCPGRRATARPRRSCCRTRRAWARNCAAPASRPPRCARGRWTPALAMRPVFPTRRPRRSLPKVLWKSADAVARAAVDGLAVGQDGHRSRRVQPGRVGAQPAGCRGGCCCRCSPAIIPGLKKLARRPDEVDDVPRRRRAARAAGNARRFDERTAPSAARSPGA